LLLNCDILWQFKDDLRFALGDCSTEKQKVLVMSHYRNQLATTEKIKIVSIAPKTQTPQKQQRRSIFAGMNQLGKLFLRAAAGEELRIWQTSDRNGNTWWHGCDRLTGRSIDAVTDSEMRAWIERRYCQ
jgi:hypothetical protein